MQKLSTIYKGVRLQFYNNNILIPLSEHSVIRIDSSMEKLANQFENAIQKKVLNKGFYSIILEIGNDANYEKGRVTVNFTAAKDRLSYPDFSLDFDYFYTTYDNGVWAILPTLGIECFTEDKEKIDATVLENIKLEFARNKRLTAVQNIVSTIWMDIKGLESEAINFEFHTPSELQQLNQEQQERILPKVAQKLSFSQPITFGRKAELKQLAEALKGKFNKSVIIVGKSGVGKTALVWELVRQKNKFGIKADIYETTASTMIKELTQDTGWQDNLVYLCRELSKEGNFLFIRNLLELFEVGQYEGNAVSMAEYLRSFVGRGEVTLVSECSEEEFAKIELKSPNFLSLFQIIRLQEPKTDLEEIIIQKVESVAKTKRIVIDEEAIKETIRLNRRYMPYSGFPGKPIRFLESIILNEKAAALDQINYIGQTKVIQHFCEDAGMPEFMVNPEIPMDLKAIKSFFSQNVFGQNIAVNSVTNLLASVKTALTRQGKPIASFLFVGPTGVGKTEMGKVLAEFMFGSRERMIRFDMSEYSSPHSVMRLTGTSYFEDGLLTSAVKREPFCVLLFDEIEKASPTFYDLLLQLLSEGRLTDSSGKLVNFCSTIIIMTSNIGASNLQTNKIGWSKEIDVKSVNQHFLSAVQKHFRPELFNRIDEVIPFQPLAKTDIRFIVNREIKLFKEREGIRFRKMDLYLEDAVLDYLGEVGYDPKYGARKLQRIVREELIIPLAHELNTFEFDEQLVVNLSVWENKIAIDIESDPFKFDLLLEELEKYQYADHAGELRRSVQRLKEGSFFVQMLSNLDLLERQKVNNTKKFWKNDKKAKKYALYLSTIERLEKLTEKIEVLEDELSLSCMDLAKYKTSIISDIKQWENHYFEYKIDLFNRIKPQSNQAKFYLLGSEIDLFIQFYTALFAAKNFKYEARTIWYSETYFNEIIEKVKWITNENGESEKVIEKEKRLEYIYESFDNSIEEQECSADNTAKLLGLEFVIGGTCPHLFLMQENGLHEWIVSNTKTVKAYVQMLDDVKSNLSNNLHTKKFWVGKKQRRTYQFLHLKDTIFEINREVKKTQHLDYILAVLNKRFEAKLNAELM